MMTPLLSNAEAIASMQPVFDFANTVYSSGINTVDSY
jgi:hypothetical protein